ncbi:hypothetical protein ACP70R_032481 [Stipagrostis hirtigluma subsp. patula]
MLSSHVSSFFERPVPSSSDRNKYMRCIQQFIKNDYFDTCTYHAEWKKRGDKNMFCFSCALDDPSSTFHCNPVCSICVVSDHTGHDVIQVRKSSYRDVVRVSDIERFVDVQSIQVYTINGGRVVFLRSRKPRQETSKIIRGFDKNYKFFYCEQCGYVLFQNCRFCSLQCKLLVAGYSSDVACGNVHVPSFRKTRRKGLPFRSNLDTSSDNSDVQPRSNKKVKILIEHILPSSVVVSSSGDKSRLVRGVRRRRSGRYVAEFRNPGTRERRWLGTSDTAEEATYAYNNAGQQLFPCNNTSDDAVLVNVLPEDNESNALVYSDGADTCPTMDMLIDMSIQTRKYNHFLFDELS